MFSKWGMPNRIIRESCRTSKTLDRLSADAERLCWRLMTVADDYGRFESEASIVKSACFPLKETLKSRQVECWLQELSRAPDPMIVLYQVDGKRYGAFLKWDKHQTRRAKHSKYPPQTDANICKQTHANVSEERGTRNEERGVGASAGESAFEGFWTYYPRKVGKHDARIAWDKLKPDAALVSRMLRALSTHSASRQWSEDGGKYIPHASTWLNKRRWEDEIQEAHAKPYNPVAGEQLARERRARERVSAGPDASPAAGVGQAGRVGGEAV